MPLSRGMDAGGRVREYSRRPPGPFMGPFWAAAVAAAILSFRCSSHLVDRLAFDFPRSDCLITRVLRREGNIDVEPKTGNSNRQNRNDKHTLSAATYQFFFCCSSAAATLCLVASYMSSLAWIRILLVRAPSAARDLSQTTIKLDPCPRLEAPCQQRACAHAAYACSTGGSTHSVLE